VGQPLSLVALVTDDGVPKPRGGQSTAGASGRGGERGAERGPADPGNPTGLLTPRGQNPAYTPPSRITVGKANGLHLSWFVYRGAGKVTFDPPQVKVWEDTRAGANSPWAPQWSAPPIPPNGKQPVLVTFSDPGTYVLRCRADDGALVADEEVTIVVAK
jgi:hypothetical protein